MEFGQFPVSGFFWDAVATMQDPMDYVCRLSLTFEQANLDYAKHYATAFKEVGDTRSSKVLERINWWWEVTVMLHAEDLYEIFYIYMNYILPGTTYPTQKGKI